MKTIFVKILVVLSLFGIIYACKKDLQIEQPPAISEEINALSEWYNRQIMPNENPQAFANMNKPDWRGTVVKKKGDSTLFTTLLLKDGQIVRELQVIYYDESYTGLVRQYEYARKDSTAVGSFTINGRMLDIGYFDANNKYTLKAVTGKRNIVLMGTELPIVDVYPPGTGGTGSGGTGTGGTVTPPTGTFPIGTGGSSSSTYFSESEFDNVLANLKNGLNGDPIEFYLIASYKNSKLLNSSTYSVGANSIKVGDYTLTPHYDSKGVLKFYSASRNTTFGIEYIVRADALSKFQNNYTLYSAAANAFYFNGIPSHSQIQMASGDFFAGLTGSWASAIQDPAYYAYLTHVLYGIGVNTFELQPSGLGSTGRTTANNLDELLAMKEIMSDPTRGTIAMTGMGDPRWLGWDKMQYIHYRPDGTKITIHYVGKHVNRVLIAIDDFKFVN
ncbi:hypothetical protein BWD42_12960 [Sphingobacterium sp. CZ-UAM]|uniref:hypothetical protein n=1 Tax=Sphingobacterium sp. CZ-UAM TaxID=1933868 RepID=UPI0009842BCF|nr:hypothetical protein [Sphingobacterium sp. CZ-UAM]OOG18171.1 hypothetical protein BWD42_12960 [Sphingobacterium sp. CZ-UAM]